MSLRFRLWIGFTSALVLSILPLPDLLSSFRPPWVLLFVLYIEYYLPENFKVITLCLLGLSLDVLLSTVMGAHAFSLLLTTWMATTKSRRFQFFSITQQMCLIGFFCLFYQSLLSLIEALLGFHYSLLMPITSAILGICIWPWIRLMGDSSLFYNKCSSY